MTEMTTEVAAILRAPFPANQVGKLPRITCGACSKDKFQKHCDKHQRSKCRVCDNFITSAHMHLDYVGHAGVTDRFLQADREWTWEPMAFDQTGLPALDGNGGLWIRLTVAGVTRIGYGDAQGKQGPDAVKEAIGDALRNGGMRFGVGLDLWSKTPMDDHGDTSPTPAPAQRKASPPANGAPVAKAEADIARAKLRKVCEDQGWDMKLVAGMFEDEHLEALKGSTLKETTDATLIDTFRTGLTGLSVVKAKLYRAIAESGWDKDKVADLFAGQYKAELEEATDARMIDEFRAGLYGLTDEDLKAPAKAAAS